MSVFVGIRDGSGLIYQNWSKCIFTCQPAVKSILCSLSWFHLSMGCQRSFVCQYTAKLSYLCKSCKGAKIALNPPPLQYYFHIYENFFSGANSPTSRLKNAFAMTFSGSKVEKVATIFYPIIFQSNRCRPLLQTRL